MKKYFNSLRKSVWALSAVVMLASCNDAWNDHYSVNNGKGESAVKTLAETIQELSGSQEFNEARDNFIRTLQTTYMLNGEKVVKGLTYWDLLEEDQFLTVWIPTTVTAEEWAEYLAPMESKDHKKVAREFIMSHIARFRHSVTSQTDERIYMLNDKSFMSKPSQIGIVGYDADSKKQNIRCSNGIIHVLNGKLEYLPSMYDYITKTSAYTKSRGGQVYDYTASLGKWFAKYTIEEIDEEKSVPAGYDDLTNEIKWADSVIVKKSILMDKFGKISEEDSNFVAVLPVPALWNKMYDSIADFFTFGSLEANRDSLQDFYANYTMLTDLFFNMNIQKSPSDSVTSTVFNKSYNEKTKFAYNTYKRPYDDGGLFKERCDSVLCSNGIIYIVDEWPYKDEMLHRRPIKIEAETYSYEDDVILHPRRLIPSFNGKELDNVFVAQLSHKSSALTWSVEYKIRNNLKGKYRVKLVIFPNELQKNKPNQFHPIVRYMPEKTYDVLIDSVKKLPRPPFKVSVLYNNDPTKIDTMDLGVVNFSTCNYDKDENNYPRVSILINSEVKDAQTQTAEIWLDCIILEPVFD